MAHQGMASLQTGMGLVQSQPANRNFGILQGNRLPTNPTFKLTRQAPNGALITTRKEKHDMKPHHISTLIDQLQATGKLPSEKPARKAKTPQVKPSWNCGVYIGNGITAKPVRKARQLKLNLK